MEQEKNKSGVILLLIAVIAILVVLCALLATGTVSFKSNESNNNQSGENTNEINSQVDNIINKESYSLPLNDNSVTRAIFKIYQINEVYIATYVDETQQCDKRKILIFNSHGMTLKELDLFGASIDINDDTISIKYDKSCLSVPTDDNSETIKYQVVESNIQEK